MHTSLGLLLLFSCFILTLSACGGGNFAARVLVNATNKADLDYPGAEPEPIHTGTSPASGGLVSDLKFCSKLPFSTKLIWPTSLAARDREAFKLALNISGSFEGSKGWSNLTSDFDGMGVSLGLLNQNLGSGSLQPLLLQMRDRFPSALKRTISTPHLTSLLTMLKAWEGVRGKGSMGSRAISLVAFRYSTWIARTFTRPSPRPKRRV